MLRVLLSARVSAFRWLLLAILSTFVCVATPERAAAQGTTQVQTVFSTHDFNSRQPQSQDGTLPGPAGILPAVWADVKTPGDGRTYAVGTVNVRTTRNIESSSFSNATGIGVPVYDPPYSTGFTPPTQNVIRQVVILQCSGVNVANPGTSPNPEQNILWQHYLYGHSIDPTGAVQPGAFVRRATNARGISVWPVVNPNGTINETETRVAICGETFDSFMDRNQFGPGLSNPQAIPPYYPQGWNWILSDSSSPAYQEKTNGFANGFIAVFNGAGQFLWSYQFYFEGSVPFVNPGNPALGRIQAHCAITDVSIRVEPTATGPRDVVTYCGISSFGVRNLVQDGDNTLSPILPFDPPPITFVAGYVPAGGGMDNGIGQWDGIVGRLSNDHDAPDPTATLREFHSVVGGTEQDGLFGLVEIDENRFAVVGGTAVALPGTRFGRVGDPTFPFTFTATDWNALSDYCIGVMMIFDARNVNGGGNLLLEKSAEIGFPGAVRTHARDVAVSWEDGDPDRIFVAGATDDASVFTSLQNFQPPGLLVTGTFTTGVNGFLLMAVDDPPMPYFMESRSAAVLNNGGACGVAVWGEHRDHVSTIGGNGDLQVATFFRDTPNTGLGDMLLAHRSDVVTNATNEEHPAVMGRVHATDPGRGLAYYQGSLGVPCLDPSGSGTFVASAPIVQSGGGISVDEKGRINIVGANTDGYVQFPPPVPGPTRARPYTVWYSNYANAIRTVIDMLPPGVCRTDGTGFDSTGLPLAIVAGSDGGTTPACMRLPFGPQVGVVPPVYLPRMLIDYEGLPPGPQGITPSITIDRAPPSSVVVGSFLCYGLPWNPMGTYPNYAPMHDIELWIDPLHWSLTTLLQFPSGSDQSWRFNLATLPPILGSRFTVQVITLLGTAMTPNASCPNQNPLDYTASPALVFYY